MPSDGVAIVGMACVFPGAPDLDAFWRNVEGGVDAISEVPPGRWDPLHFDPSSTAPDRFYCRRGGFVDAHATFDALSFGVMPVAAEGAEPDQLLALQVAARALADAGCADRAHLREKGAVILGRGAYLTPGMARLDQRVRTAGQLVLALRALAPQLSEAELARVKQEFQARLGPYGPDTAIGLVPNLAASRIAHRLDLRGPAYCVDAACASALIAVDHAVHELTSGRCDLVLAGGVHLCHDVTFWSVFTQLGALSREQRIRPFDRRADGLLIGEGVGVLALRRLADAQQDGDRVYAVLRGTGVASDGREASLMSPRVDGQVLALERAYRAAGVEPRSVGLVEAHGTATPAGDEAELTTLARVFGGPDPASRAVVGSVKSMIGHAMPAAGAAGLIKAALAVHHGVLPPTLHCEEPHPKLAATRFRTLAKAEPWEERGPRRAGVNAFGFGGVNGHVVLESHGAARGRRRAAAPAETDEAVLAVAAPSRAELLEALASGRAGGQGPARLAVVNPTAERRERARAIVERGRAWRGHEDVWFTEGGLLAGGGKLAFLFPGVEPAFEPRVEDVARHFGRPAPAHLAPRDLEETGLGIVEVSRLLHDALRELGLAPAAAAGHSIGEWTGMIATGVIPPAEADAFIASLKPGSLEVPDVVFAAAGCGAEKAAEALRGLPDVTISHDNCPHQVILCGGEASVEVALGRLSELQVLSQKLPFRSGFHAPVFERYLGPHRDGLARLHLRPPEWPLWSATTCEPYPADPDAVRALSLEHLVKPVRFRELVERLFAAGFRAFVQVGAGASLVGFVEDTLRGRPHVAVASNVKARPGLAQLRRLGAALWVEGAPVRLERLASPARPTPRPPMKLDLGAPLVHLAPASPRGDPGDGSLAAELAASLQELGAIQAEVVAAFRGAAAPRAPEPGPREADSERVISVETDPWLLDHSFYRQPQGWLSVADRYPVVPMTMTLELMLDAARKLVPELTSIGLEEVRAFRWLAVAPPATVKIRARFDGVDRVEVAVEGYSQATVVLARDFPAAPSASFPALRDARPAPISAEQLYTDRWMFHGPRYQGVRELGPWGEDGVRGSLESLAAPGGLLDNAGQLLGWWVMARTEVDRLAMPVRLDRVTFFGPHPPPGARLACDVRVSQLTDREVRADVALAGADGRLWCRVEGWEDRRFDSDARVWQALQWPEKSLLGEPRFGGPWRAAGLWRTLPSRDLLARRYLGEAERERWSALAPRAQSGSLLARIAAKDAVRDLLWKRGHGAIFPAELELASDATGRPLVRHAFGLDLRVSLAHKDDLGVALVTEGVDAGVDVEWIAERPAGFEALALTDAERALLPAADRDAWLARFWSAKEAAAKRRGSGLLGDPKRFVVREVVGERALVDGTWVETRVENGAVYAWTTQR